MVLWALAPFHTAPATAAFRFSASPLLPGVADNAFITHINDAGQVAVTNQDGSTYGSTALRVDRDGSVHVAGPGGGASMFVLPGGRAVVWYMLEDGRDWWGLGNDQGGFQPLRLPGDVPGDRFGVAGVTETGSIFGVVEGLVVRWSGPNFDPVTLGRAENLFTSVDAVSKMGTYVVGSAGLNRGAPGDTRVTKPFVYHNGTFVTVDIPGFDYARATAVNESGEVFGFASWQGFDPVYGNPITSGPIPFRWRDGTLDFPLAGEQRFQPFAMNDAGMVVGQGDAGQAYLWYEGQLHLLADLAGMDPWKQGLKDAFSINSRGEIIAQEVGSRLGYPTPYVLRPVPEPTRLFILGCTAPLLLRRSRRR